MLTFTAKLTIKAGREDEFANTMKDVVPKVREEPGNDVYIMHRSQDNPRVFMFYEEYTDRPALDAHRKHLQELGVNLADLMDGKPELEFYDKIA
jgi:quinol monooxygenase YgiN